jgi:Flp pilus assembly protein TadG
MIAAGLRRFARTLRRPFARFHRDERGATAVEFAMVSVPFLGLLFAIFETAFVFFTNEGLEAATADAARYIMTGQAAAGSYSSASGFRDGVICNPTAPRVRILPSFIDCSQLIVDVSTAGSSGSTSFSSADVNNDFYTNPSTNYCIGAPGDIVVVRVVYPMPSYLTILTIASLGQVSASNAGLTNYGGSMKHMLMGTAAFRNEPYQGSSTPATGCS